MNKNYKDVRNNNFSNKFNSGNRSNVIKNVDETYKKIKEDYTAHAESIMNEYFRNERSKISTNQLRNIYALVADLKEKIKYDNFNLESIKDNLKKSKIKIVYQIGRDNKNDLGIKIFNNYTNILELIDLVLKSNTLKNDLDLYCDYFEALVSYHRFYSK